MFQSGSAEGFFTQSVEEFLDDIGMSASLAPKRSFKLGGLGQERPSANGSFTGPLQNQWSQRAV